MIVRFQPAATAADQAALHARFGATLIDSIPALSIEVVSLPNAAATQAVAAAYNRNPLVTFAEPDALASFADGTATTPNDTHYSLQWQDPAIDGPKASSVTTGSNVLLVTICDTGVSAGHEDLVANLNTTLGWNTVNDTSDFSPVHWHGTATAGAAAAVGNNGKGVAGVAWTASIIPVRISDRSDGGAYFSDMAECIVYGADKGSTIINLSYQTYSSGQISPTILTAAYYADARDSVLVVAAGNENTNPAGTQDPDNILYVAATDQANQKASFSNFGPYIDVAAPGVDVVTTYVTVKCRGARGCSVTRDSQYAYVSGTSFSAPITAGAVLLVRAANPGLTTAGQLRAAITGGACDLGATGADDTFGVGLLNAHHAVHNEPCGPAPAPDTTPPAVAVTAPNGGETWTVGTANSITWNATDGIAVTAVDLSYSTSGVDGLFTAIASGITNTGSYNWTVPNTPSMGAFVKVVAHDAAGYSAKDLSNAAFTIEAASGGGAAAPDSLTATKVQTGKTTKVDLAWSGGAATVEVQRNSGGAFITVATVSNTGSYRDKLGKSPASGTYTYQVCNAGTNDCATSNTVSIP